MKGPQMWTARPSSSLKFHSNQCLCPVNLWPSRENVTFESTAFKEWAIYFLAFCVKTSKPDHYLVTIQRSIVESCRFCCTVMNTSVSMALAAALLELLCRYHRCVNTHLLHTWIMNCTSCVNAWTRWKLATRLIGIQPSLSILRRRKKSRCRFSSLK